MTVTPLPPRSPALPRNAWRTRYPVPLSIGTGNGNAPWDRATAPQALPPRSGSVEWLPDPLRDDLAPGPGRAGRRANPGRRVMTDTRCRYCLEHHATCEARRLFAGRSCCPECTHRIETTEENR